jgi:hypothetical protein
VEQHKNQETKTPDERAGLAEPERAETIAQLYLRKSKLSPEEAPLLREAFKEIFDKHFDLVWARVRRRVHDNQDAEELLQEAFLTLHSHILEHGFPDSIPGMLTKITDGKVSNHLRARMFALLDVGLRAGAGSFRGARALQPKSRRAWPTPMPMPAPTRRPATIAVRVALGYIQIQ